MPGVGKPHLLLIVSRVRNNQKNAYARAAKMSTAAFSAIMMVGALVLPDTSVGMIDASTTRKFWHP